MFNKKVKYYLINQNRDIIKSDVKFKIPPRQCEVIYFDYEGPYYKVINILHHINSKHTIWILIEEIKENN